jgi:hypothetical protein
MAHKRFLKTAFSVFAAVIFCGIVFIACGGGDDNPNNTNPGTTNPGTTNPGANGVTLSGTYDYVTLASLGQKNIFNSNGTFKKQYNMNTVTETPTYNYTVTDNIVYILYVEGLPIPEFYIYNSNTLFGKQGELYPSYELYVKEGSSYPVSGKYKSDTGLLGDFIFDGNGSVIRENNLLSGTVDGPYKYEVSGRKITVTGPDRYSSFIFYTLDSNTIEELYFGVNGTSYAVYRKD